MDALSARDVTVTKDKKTILEKLNLSVKRGSVTGLVGPSGSGKTTLMRSIVGVQKTASGSLEVLGAPAGSPSLRSRIGYVTQDSAVYDDITVEENLTYFGSLVGASRSSIDGVLADVDLVPQRKQMVSSLSGGQRARVNLAVALLGEPELLVLDEPTVGLDPILRNNLWDMFMRLAKNGKTLLVSSHVMDEAERCEQLILLRDGEVLWNDTKQKLLSHTHATNVGDAFVKAIEEAEV